MKSGIKGKSRKIRIRKKRNKIKNKMNVKWKIRW